MVRRRKGEEKEDGMRPDLGGERKRRPVLNGRSEKTEPSKAPVSRSALGLYRRTVVAAPPVFLFANPASRGPENNTGKVLDWRRKR